MDCVNHELLPSTHPNASKDMMVCKNCTLILIPAENIINVYGLLVDLFGGHSAEFAEAKSKYEKFVKDNKK